MVKTTRKAEAKGGRHVRLVLQVHVEHVSALEEEARSRKEARRREPPKAGRPRIDVSAVAREVFDAWLGRRR